MLSSCSSEYAWQKTSFVPYSSDGFPWPHVIYFHTAATTCGYSYLPKARFRSTAIIRRRGVRPGRGSPIGHESIAPDDGHLYGAISEVDTTLVNRRRRKTTRRCALRFFFFFTGDIAHNDIIMNLRAGDRSHSPVESIYSLDLFGALRFIHIVRNDSIR